MAQTLKHVSCNMPLPAAPRPGEYMSCPPRGPFSKGSDGQDCQGQFLVARYPGYNRADRARHDGHMPQAQMCIDKFRISG